jgi:hypothetical protein
MQGVAVPPGRRVATEDRAGDGATLGLEKMGSNATTGAESSNGTDGVDRYQS